MFSRRVLQIIGQPNERSDREFSVWSRLQTQLRVSQVSALVLAPTPGSSSGEVIDFLFSIYLILGAAPCPWGLLSI
jgi:hypothetical protein